MAEDFVNADEIDRRFRWTMGTAERLARQKRLPHYLLPNGGLRFRWNEVASLIQHITPTAESVRHGSNS